MFDLCPIIILYALITKQFNFVALANRKYFDSHGIFKSRTKVKYNRILCSLLEKQSTNRTTWYSGNLHSFLCFRRNYSIFFTCFRFLELECFDGVAIHFGGMQCIQSVGFVSHERKESFFIHVNICACTSWSRPWGYIFNKWIVEPFEISQLYGSTDRSTV